MFVSGRFRAWIGGVAAFAMLAVAAAPAWHRHDDACGPRSTSSHEHGCDHDAPGGPDHDPHDRPAHPDCPVCVAVHAPTGGGLPSPAVVPPMLQWTERPIERFGPEPTVHMLPVLWPCGPPAPKA